MTFTSISTDFTSFGNKAFKSSRWAVLLLVATFMSTLPAHAQSSDTWKSIAIIGASTAAGAYIGHRVAGPTGAYVGAAVGATAGYAIDRRRRQNEYYNNDYPYGNDGSYSNNSGYYGNGDPYYDNGGQYPNDRSGSNDPYYNQDDTYPVRNSRRR